MPTNQITVTTASAKHVEYDSERTGLALVNMDDTDVSYVSDVTPVTTSNGFPIYPKTYMSLDRKRGWSPEKAYYLIGSAEHTVAVIEAFGETEAEKQAKEIKASPQNVRRPR